MQGKRKRMSDDRTAESGFAAPPPDPELKRLKPLLGTWDSDGTTPRASKYDLDEEGRGETR
jgi:hypothetical protein